MAVLICACLAGSCKDDDPAAPDSLYMHSLSGTVEAAAGTQSVTIYTTCGWTAAGDDWITIEPLSGGEKGIFAVHLGFGANDTAHRPGHLRRRNLFGNLHPDAESAINRSPSKTGTR